MHHFEGHVTIREIYSEKSNNVPYKVIYITFKAFFYRDFLNKTIQQIISQSNKFWKFTFSKLFCLTSFLKT